MAFGTLRCRFRCFASIFYAGLPSGSQYRALLEGALPDSARLQQLRKPNKSFNQRKNDALIWKAPVLLFLHADTHLPPGALAELQAPGLLG